MELMQSWAEMFGAVGTVGAVIVALSASARSEAKERRQQANQVSVHWTAEHDGSGVRHMCQIRNDSAYPIYRPAVIEPGILESWLRVKRVDPHSEEILGYASAAVAGEVTWAEHRMTRYTEVGFRDVNSRAWIRAGDRTIPAAPHGIEGYRPRSRRRRVAGWLRDRRHPRRRTWGCPNPRSGKRRR